MTTSYVLEGSGWARASIEHGGHRREMRFSWCSDALSRMIDAATRVAAGAPEARFGFTDEPGEHECAVTRNGPDQVLVRTFWYREWTPPGPDTGEQVFSCSCAASHFCAEVFRCAKQLLDDHGTEGYKELWVEHEFPDGKFENLSKLLYPPRKLARR